MTYPTPQRAGFWRRLTVLQRVALITVALILPCLGGVTVAGVFASGGDDAPKTDRLAADVQAVETTAAAPTTAATAPATAEETAAATVTEAADAPTTQAPAPTTAAPAVVTKTRTVEGPIPFGTRKVSDDSLAEGKTRVRTKGVPGVKTITWQITYTNGKPTERRMVKTVVKRKPVTQVIAVGAKAASECDPNYSGCVPIASDVDCAGGSGNGPAYVKGPVNVIGDDIYDLDRDGDGVACDS
ncbi:G5 domain-containing protein [Paractinoplanes lichenicola]|uniref:G5 domain-containing protein n=1 Tax=Paractinoplanes lichenicola TaxID=2802976 RepID=UPI0027DBF13B|nr:G5 domain-containing protein [Actinoplanes lichenicola]